MDSERIVVVVGAGVIGLTTAITLIESGIRTKIISSLPSEETTSMQAGALWHPFLVSPSAQVLRWSMDTYATHLKLLDVPGSGVSMTILTEYFDESAENVWWLKELSDVYRIPHSDLPERFKDGFTLSVPLIEPHYFLKYLKQRFLLAGGEIEIRCIHAFDKLLHDYQFVINCTGLASKELCADDELYPVWGQTLLLESDPAITRCFIDDTRAEAGFPTYIFPRSGDILIGGFAGKGKYFEEPTDENTASIFQRCSELHPSVARLRVYKAQGGSRPARKEVRLEVDSACHTLIHNYGHSGSGFTLCWGCAQTVLEIINHQSLSLY